LKSSSVSKLDGSGGERRGFTTRKEEDAVTREKKEPCRAQFEKKKKVLSH